MRNDSNIFEGVFCLTKTERHYLSGNRRIRSDDFTFYLLYSIYSRC